MRRRAFATLLPLLAIPAMAAGDGPAGHHSDQKAVYRNDGGRPDNATDFKHILGNPKNHVVSVGKDHIEVRVVDFGDGVDLFHMAVKDTMLAQRIDDLEAEGVRVLICRSTLPQRKIDWHELHGVTEADIVPSGVAEIVRLQVMGFSYVHP